MIIIKQAAKEDLQQIKEYISKDSIFYANKTINEIYKRRYNLLLFPEMGRVIDENNNTRQIIYKSYKILYRFDSNNIYIVHIIHHSRNISYLKL